MKLAFISDIHANFEGLSVLLDVLREADRVICLGDLVGYYCQVNEVINSVRELGALCILGNHDYYLLYGFPETVPASVRFGIDVARKIIAPEHRLWLTTLPLVLGLKLDCRSILLSHGSPWDPINAYLYADSPALSRARHYDFDVVAFGQTHRIFYENRTKPVLLNPGSVGQSRDARAEACAILLDTHSLEAQVIRRKYDVSRVISLALKYAAGSWISKHLL